jgi:hypothetical protein
MDHIVAQNEYVRAVPKGTQQWGLPQKMLEPSSLALELYVSHRFYEVIHQDFGWLVACSRVYHLFS